VVAGYGIRYIRCGFDGWRRTQLPDSARTHLPVAASYHAGVEVTLMKILFRWSTIAAAFTVAAIVYAVRTKQSHGRFLRVPYDFRVPTLQRLKDRFWNPDDPRIFTPHVFGVGWSINAYQLLKQLRGDETEVPEGPKS